MTFQAYLQSTPPDTIQSVESFENFIENRPGMVAYSYFYTLR